MGILLSIIRTKLASWASGRAALASNGVKVQQIRNPLDTRCQPDPESSLFAGDPVKVLKRQFSDASFVIILRERTTGAVR